MALLAIDAIDFGPVLQQGGILGIAAEQLGIARRAAPFPQFLLHRGLQLGFKL